MRETNWNNYRNTVRRQSADQHYVLIKMRLAATAAVAALFDSYHQLGTETGYLRLVMCLLGIRQQSFKSVNTLLKVDSLFEIHGYFTFKPSL